MKSIRYFIPCNTAENIYLAVIRSVLEYGDVVYDNITKEQSDKLDKLEREAMITCTRGYRSSHEKLQVECGWQPLTYRRRDHRLVMFYKIFNGICPEHLSKLSLPKTKDNNPRNLRNLTSKYNVLEPNSRIVTYYNSFVPRTACDWNSLHDTVKSAQSYQSFKSSLKKLNPFRSNKLFTHFDNQESVHHT